MDIESIPIWSPLKTPRLFEPFYTGWIYKQGHQIKNWKKRFFIIKGCLMLYYKTDLIYTQNYNELPKGIHIVIGIRSYIKDKTIFIIDTYDNKVFYLKDKNENNIKYLISILKYSIKYYEKYFKIYELLDNQIILSICLITVGYLDIAIQLLEDYIKININSVEGLYHLGTAYIMRDTNEALENSYQTLQSCVELEPSHINARTNLGLVAFMRGDLDEAKRILLSVLSESPTCIEAVNNLAVVLVQRGEPGDIELAESKLQYALQSNSNNYNLYLTYVDILLLMKQKNNAIELLQKGIQTITPKNSQLYCRLGELIYCDGDKETGIEYLTEAVDIDPRNKRAIEMLQHTLRKRAESQANTLEIQDTSSYRTLQQQQQLQEQHEQLQNEQEHEQLQQGEELGQQSIISTSTSTLTKSPSMSSEVEGSPGLKEVAIKKRRSIFF